MKTRTVAAVSFSTAMVLLGFQNCGSSLPSNINSASSNETAATSGAKRDCSLDGTLVDSGTVKTAYTESVAENSLCPAMQTLTCTDGMWLGSAVTGSGIGTETGNGTVGTQTSFAQAFSSCQSVDLSCSVVGTTIASGSSTTAYTASSVAYNSSCSSVQATLSCDNGVVTASTGAAISAFVSSTCSVAAYSGTYNYTGELWTPSYNSPQSYQGIPNCPGNAGGQGCSSPGAQCYVDYGNYQDGYSYFHGYTCQ